jgi:hypothetical protein
VRKSAVLAGQGRLSVVPAACPIGGDSGESRSLVGPPT